MRQVMRARGRLITQQPRPNTAALFKPPSLRKGFVYSVLYNHQSKIMLFWELQVSHSRLQDTYTGCSNKLCSLWVFICMFFYCNNHLFPCHTVWFFFFILHVILACHRECTKGYNSTTVNKTQDQQVSMWVVFMCLKHRKEKCIESVDKCMLFTSSSSLQPVSVAYLLLVYVKLVYCISI